MNEYNNFKIKLVCINTVKIIVKFQHNYFIRLISLQ